MIETTEIKEFVDASTGEVLNYESIKTIRKKVTAETFYMVFLDYVKVFPSLKKSGINNLVLQQFCKIAEFNTGNVNLPAKVREDVCTELGISTQQLTNAINALKEDKLIAGARGLYQINPQIFWKGDQRIRKNELLNNKELQVTFSLVDAE